MAERKHRATITIDLDARFTTGLTNEDIAAFVKGIIEDGNVPPCTNVQVEVGRVTIFDEEELRAKFNK